MKPILKKSKETKAKTGVSPRWKLYQLLHQLKTREAMQLAEQSLKRCVLIQDYSDVILTPADLLRAAKGSRQLQGFPQLPYPIVDSRRRALKVLPKSTLTAIAH